MLTLNVNVIIRDENGVRENLSKVFQVSPEEKVNSLVGQISADKGKNVKLLFAGKLLNKQKRLIDYHLASSTKITAIVSNETDDYEIVSKEQCSNEKPTQSLVKLFFGYCKKCEKISNTKLRVNCKSCLSDSVRVISDPNNWNDLRKYAQLYCFRCDDKKDSNFYFKCQNCSNEAVGLKDYILNTKDKLCVICENNASEVVSLSCDDVICNFCFWAYMEEVSERFGFVYRKEYGFTIACPMQGCVGCVEDVHLFYILGNDAYKKFQKISTERFIAMQENTVFCPYPDCGDAFIAEGKEFIIEESEEYGIPANMTCPSCKRNFCIACSEVMGCICFSSNHHDKKSRETIEKTCKKCPHCGTQTEKNEGCNAIKCLICSTKWCWICETFFTDECRENHWFL
uniref:RBR-type E3 ubiquitin transferase n=1 Tax=Strongyloides papillosus TaxID=174720 RepID=A0A0N5BAH8_STREA